MFFILSKIIYWLVMPVSLIAWALLASIFVKNKKRKSIFGITGIVLFFIFTNPFLASLTINAWEPDYKAYDSLRSRYKYGIVLSGITNPDRPPFDRIQFNKGADRIVHAIDLYRRGVIENILITGGSGVITYEGKKESHKLRDFAIQSGVDSAAVLIEDEARNTHENAVYSLAMLENKYDSNLLLITSAFHMHRAQGCFEKEGASVVPFPTDHYGKQVSFTPDDLIIPSLYSLKIWTILTKEWLGLLAYKFAGYI